MTGAAGERSAVLAVHVSSLLRFASLVPLARGSSRGGAVPERVVDALLR